MFNEIYDIAGLAKDLELEFGDITDLYISYIDEIAQHCANLVESFNKKDCIELKNEIHSLKGVAANLLIKDVFEMACSLEMILKQVDFTISKEHVESLTNLLINSKNKVIQSFAMVNVIL